jgi:uncharacterized protein (DUF849 family)
MITIAAPDPVILAVAPTGARKSRADHPALPITPPELATTAAPDEDSEADAASFVAWVARERIGVQWIIYAADEVRRLASLRRRGIIDQTPPFTLFVLGRYAADRTGRPADLLPFLAAVDADAGGPWAVCAFGQREAACALTAAPLGGHIRVGFENNVLLADGAIATDNESLIEQTASALPVVGCRAADAHQARAILALG